MRKVGLVVALVMTLFVVIPVGAQENVIYDACPYLRGAYYQPGIFPRYEHRNQRLVLESWNTGEVVGEVEISLVANRFGVISWSPDCRYLAGRLDGDAAVWDIPNRQRVTTFNDIYSRGYRVPAVAWDPTSSYALVETEHGGFLWQAAANNVLMIHPDEGNLRRGYHRIGWDLRRGELLTVRIGFGHSVAAYDLQTGAQVGNFGLPDRAAPVNFAFSPDNSRIIVFTARDEVVYDQRQFAMSVWNRDTLAGVAVDVNRQTPSSSSQVALSTDNRYLVAGRSTIRVWDLTNLPAGIEERDPIYIHNGPAARIQRIRFVDQRSFETIDRFGSVQVWDLFSGRPVS